MLKRVIFTAGMALFTVLFFLGTYAAGQTKEKIFTREHLGTSIKIAAYGDVEPTEVLPEIQTKKGEEKGQLYVTVELKNTGGGPDKYYVFASGVSKGGVGEGGNLVIPGDGVLAPGQNAKGKVKTNFRGKNLPPEILIEIYSSAELKYEPGSLEALGSDD